MIPKHQQKSILSGYSVPKISDQGESFHVSFRHLDKSQGQTFENWQEEKILASALHTLCGYCSRPLVEQQGKKFTVYGDFPPKNKTDFYHPKHVPTDAKWARIHVNGLQIIAGHVFKNTFYVVFLDKEHKFYKSELKNT
jgi:hypothetical protein